MALQENQFNLFITSVQHYFRQVTSEVPEFSPPYILDGSLHLKAFTGSISVTGNHHGTIHFTADLDLLDALLERLGESRRDSHALKDMIGEVANTISGNFRREFGQHFTISTPRIECGNNMQMHPGEGRTTYVVPMEWASQKAFLIVAFQKAE